jgi:hypothetical protein
MDSIKRKLEFKNAAPTPVKIVDSRFGIRKMILSNERSSVAGYKHPGKGVNGEHQN